MGKLLLSRYLEVFAAEMDEAAKNEYEKDLSLRILKLADELKAQYLMEKVKNEKD